MEKRLQFLYASETKRSLGEHDTVAGCGGGVDEAVVKYSSLQGVCADAGYRKTFEEFVHKVLKKTVEISARITPGWAILAKRWVG